MKVRRAVGCGISAALVARFNRGWCSGSLTADPLRNAKNLHGRLVILIVRRPLRAGPRAYRASAPGQKRTPITEYRKNHATCHASPSAPPRTSPVSPRGELGNPPGRPHAVRAARHAGRRRLRPWSGMLRSPTLIEAASIPGSLTIGPISVPQGPLLLAHKMRLSVPLRTGLAHRFNGTAMLGIAGRVLCRWSVRGSHRTRPRWEKRPRV